MDRSRRRRPDRRERRGQPDVRWDQAGQAGDRAEGRPHRPWSAHERARPAGHRRRTPGAAGGVTEVPLTPVMRQYREAKEQHPDGILMFRLGDFYEVFFEDAEVAAPVMRLTLTPRPLRQSVRAPLCAVPHPAWLSYVR